eukprot:8394174-Alexandrium_andersonii.AAC.1
MEVDPPSRPRGTSPRASPTSPSAAVRACPPKDFRVSADPTLTAVRYNDKSDSSQLKQVKQVRVLPGLV